MDKKTRILLVDDHTVVVEGIKSALADEADLEVVGEAYNGMDAIKLAESLKPNIVVMDIAMPGLNGIEASKHIKKVLPDVKIIIFTMYSQKEYVIDLFKSGISAYVLKEDPLADLFFAIQAVRKGGTYFSSAAPTLIVKHLHELEESKQGKVGFDRLSLREQEVFQLLAEGLPIKVIAEKLCISRKTVESHKYNIMEKLNVTSMVEITKIAIQKGIIKI
ncbi:MAG: response regulator transcription factor [Pseudomonadota bacterium]